jgi:phospholipase/carboxylesterase
MIASLTPMAILPMARRGPRPRTHDTLPHLQLDQFPGPEITGELLDRARRIPIVNVKQSRMAAPDSLALYLPDEYAGGPPEAFIDGHEFCHLHALPEGGIHLTLPKLLREVMVELGWGERHPIAKAGILTTLVTVYAPRDPLELEIALNLIGQSCQFAQGNLRPLQGGDYSWLEAQ